MPYPRAFLDKKKREPTSTKEDMVNYSSAVNSFFFFLSKGKGARAKLTWTVMAVLPTPPSPRTVILKSIRTGGPCLA